MPGAISRLDFFDFDNRQFLPVANRLMITFAPLHFESDLLLTANVLDNIGDYRRARDCGHSNGHFPVVIDQKNTIKSKRLPDVDGQAFNFQSITRHDTILLTASFQYSVHKSPRKKG